MITENETAPEAAPVAPASTTKPKRVRKPAAKRPAATKRKARKAKRVNNARRKTGAKVGRPKGSKLDSVKLVRTGKRTPRAGTVRFAIVGAFARPRTVGSAIETLARGFKPPRLKASAVKANPGAYFRLAISLMMASGILKRAK
jgi:hypothetical protein